MSRDPLRLPDYLGHIHQAIERIQKYTDGMDEAGFLSNAMVQDAVVRNFEIIGEASRNIERVAPEFVNQHPELPLKFAYDMRNQLSHGYFQVDLGIVWRTSKRNLPTLGEQIGLLYESLREHDTNSTPKSDNKSIPRD